MATALDNQIGPLALSLIGNFGKNMTLLTKGDNTYDITTGTVTNTPTSIPIKAVVDKPTRISQDPTLDTRGMLTLYIAGWLLDKAPTPTDIMVIDSINYNVMFADPIYSGELVAVWMLTVKA